MICCFAGAKLQIYFRIPNKFTACHQPLWLEVMRQVPASYRYLFQNAVINAGKLCMPLCSVEVGEGGQYVLYGLAGLGGHRNEWEAQHVIGQTEQIQQAFDARRVAVGEQGFVEGLQKRVGVGGLGI